MSAMDTAVYWTEYVIRHKGAAHLKPVTVDMPWYQYLLLDIIALYALVFYTVMKVHKAFSTLKKKAYARKLKSRKVTMNGHAKVH